MSYNGSGTFQINTSGQPVVTGTSISSTVFNALTADLATGLSTAITKDGQTTTTARIPFALGINSTLVTDATNTTSGSIITAGGVGIAKALYVGTTANIAGTTTLSGLTASSAVATDASKNLVSVTNTGTGNNVLATSPTLVTPALGTPTSGIMTNVTGINYDGFKNRIINGAMVIDQRNAGNTVNNTTSNLYTLDRWAIYGTVSAKFRVAQSGMPAVNSAGFSSCIQIYSLAATTVSATDIYIAAQAIEGYNFADMLWGTASALPVTLSFWVYSTLTGTFGGYVKGGATYTYPFTYTVSAANTWTKATVTIPGQTAGTWPTTTSAGVYVGFSFGTGSTYTAAANSWTSGDYYGATGQTQFVSTSAATMYITGVQLEKGSTATAFDYRPYGTELALCQRYYVNMGGGTSDSVMGTGFKNAANQVSLSLQTPVTLRATPSITVVGSIYALGNASNNICTGSASNIILLNPNGFRFLISTTAVLTDNVLYGMYTGNVTNYINVSAEL
jgi:hypothetical protein